MTSVQAARRRGYPRGRVWAQDESRCGLLPIVRHRIPARGVPPVVSSASRVESLYLYGAVEPATGQSVFLALPTLNTQGFQLFLAHVTALDPTSFQLLLLDNGAFHKAQALQLPPNVALLFFPPSAPELNPTERLWRDLKDWLAPTVPLTLDDLSPLLMIRLNHYSAAVVRSLTGFPHFLRAAPVVHG